MADNINAIDWKGLKSGATLNDIFFVGATLLKLDDNKASYTRNGNSTIVDVKEYSVKAGVGYSYFQVGNSWFPLTEKYWKEDGK
jgi:hypothetical protein